METFAKIQQRFAAAVFTRCWSTAAFNTGTTSFTEKDWRLGMNRLFSLFKHNLPLLTWHRYTGTRLPMDTVIRSLNHSTPLIATLRRIHRRKHLLFIRISQRHRPSTTHNSNNQKPNKRHRSSINQDQKPYFKNKLDTSCPSVSWIGCMETSHSGKPRIYIYFLRRIIHLSWSQ